VNSSRLTFVLSAAALYLSCAWCPGPVAQAAPEAPAAVQFKPEGPDASALAVRVAGALLALGILAFGVIFALKKFAPWMAVPGAQPGRGGLRVIESMRVTQKLSLFVVEFGGERILLACTDRAVTVVSGAARGGTPGRGGETP